MIVESREINAAASRMRTLSFTVTPVQPAGLAFRYDHPLSISPVKVLVHSVAVGASETDAAPATTTAAAAVAKNHA